MIKSFGLLIFLFSFIILNLFSKFDLVRSDWRPFEDGYYLLDAASSMVGLTTRCNYIDNIFLAVKRRLNKYIKGQEEGIHLILNAIASWEFNRKSGIFEPLVLAFTGPTGVGKSETSVRLAEALLQGSGSFRLQTGLTPNDGFLVLRGEDFSSDAFEGDVTEMQNTIRRRTVDLIRRCEGRGVVVFDEIQKVAPGALQVLMSALEERGTISLTEHYEDTFDYTFKTATKAYETLIDFFGIGSTIQNENKRHNKQKQIPQIESSKLNSNSKLKMTTNTYSTENLVFIFISDIGASKMEKILLAYGERELIPLNILRQGIKATLDRQWERLELGKVIKEVVPFLPLEPVHLRQIFQGKVGNIAEKRRFQWWHDLLIDEEVVRYLVGSKFIKYSEVEATVRPDCEENGEEQTCPELGDQKLTKFFAFWGARALENAGPLQELNSLIFRYMQPWRSEEILHVGLITDRNREQSFARWGKRPVSSEPELFLQWCTPLHSMVKSSVLPPFSQFDDQTKLHIHQCSDNDGEHQTDFCMVDGVEFLMLNYSISDEHVFSDACETVWYGKVSS